MPMIGGVGGGGDKQLQKQLSTIQNIFWRIKTERRLFKSTTTFLFQQTFKMSIV